MASKKPRFFSFLNLKNLKSPKLVFFYFFFGGGSNFIQIILTFIPYFNRDLCVLLYFKNALKESEL